MKKFTFYFILFLIISTYIINYSNTHTLTLLKNNSSTQNNSSIQYSISKKLIRFHVVGNSNSKFDQNLKLRVKHAITSYLEPKLKDVSSIHDARKIIKRLIPSIKKVADNVLKENNINYSISANLKKDYFPQKKYGDLTLPKGIYESLTINLGKSKGRNWWCVLYPSLCFIDSTYAIIPNDSKAKLKKSLTSTEYEYIMNSPSTKVNYKSAFSEYLNKCYDFCNLKFK